MKHVGIPPASQHARRTRAGRRLTAGRRKRPGIKVVTEKNVGAGRRAASPSFPLRPIGRETDPAAGRGRREDGVRGESTEASMRTVSAPSRRT